MKNVPNGSILWKGKETSLTVLFYSCLFPSRAQSTLKSAHLARPHILGMHLYACRGTGCGVRRLLHVLVCWYYRIFVEYQLFTKNCVLSMVLFSSLYSCEAGTVSPIWQINKGLARWSNFPVSWKFRFWNQEIPEPIQIPDCSVEMLPEKWELKRNRRDLKVSALLQKEQLLLCRMMNHRSFWHAIKARGHSLRKLFVV